MDIGTVLQQNQLASGGLLLMALGSVLAALRGLPGYCWRWIVRRFVTTVEIKDTDRAYPWLLYWASHRVVTPKTNDLSVITVVKGERGRIAKDAGMHSLDTGSSYQITYAPGAGTPHLVIHRGRRVFFVRHVDKPEGGGLALIALAGSIGGGERERIVMRTWAHGGRALIESILTEAREECEPTTTGLVEVYVPSWDSWRCVDRVKVRALDSVILPKGQSESLLADIRWFTGAEEWYRDRGIPWRRGYLLYGPPGTGKTSWATALAGAIGRNIYIANLASSMINDRTLHSYLSTVEPGGIVLMEDVDCVFRGREKQGKDDGITFSGFLNALDGVLAGSGRLVFMTTNQPNLLDEALTRPGRVDRKVLFDLANTHQAHGLYTSFFGSQPQCDGFVEHSVSMASLQEVFVSCRNDSALAWNTAVELSKKQRVGDGYGCING